MEENRCTDKKKLIWDDWITAALALCMLFGNVRILNIHIMGIVPTVFRVLIPLITIWFLIKRMKNRAGSQAFTRLTKYFLILMVCWIGYGMIQLFVSPWVIKREGLKELLAVALGGLSVYCIYEACTTKRGMRVFLKTLRFATYGLILFAFFEICTGIHLSTSCFNDPEFVRQIVTDPSENAVWYLSTGIFYNQNDFSMLLTILSPLLFANGEMPKWRRIVDWIAAASIMVILTINDAWILIVSFGIGLFAYLITIRAKIWAYVGGLAMVVAVQKYIGGWVAKLLHLFPTFLGGSSTTPVTEYVGGAYSLEEVVASQLSGYGENVGSMFNRLWIWLDGLAGVLHTYGLGVGPAAFGRYIASVGSKSYLTNPHSWWLEILAQYGIVIFLGYTVLIVIAFIQLIRLCWKSPNSNMARIIGLCAAFVLACMSPSSVIQMSAIWLPAGLCLAAGKLYAEEKEKPTQR